MAGALASLVLQVGGCGGQEQAPPAPKAAKAEGAKAENPYVEVLLGLRDAARANDSYDAYGYAEYMPDSQRAAIDAFCLVASRVRTDAEIRKLTDPGYFSSRVAATAKPESRSASMAAVRRDVRKLRTIVEADSLSGPLVKSYVKACY